MVCIFIDKGCPVAGKEMCFWNLRIRANIYVLLEVLCKVTPQIFFLKPSRQAINRVFFGMCCLTSCCSPVAEDEAHSPSLDHLCTSVACVWHLSQTLCLLFILDDWSWERWSLAFSKSFRGPYPSLTYTWELLFHGIGSTSLHTCPIISFLPKLHLPFSFSISF